MLNDSLLYLIAGLKLCFAVKLNRSHNKNIFFYFILKLELLSSFVKAKTSYWALLLLLALNLTVG